MDQHQSYRNTSKVFLFGKVYFDPLHVSFGPCDCIYDKKTKRTSFHKGVFLGPEYFNNILGTNSHIKGTCIAANFESNGPLVWCLLSIKSGWGNSIPVLPEVMN